MIKAPIRHRKKDVFAKPCSATDIEVRAHTIITFDKELWSNLNDGTFILKKTVTQNKSQIKTVADLFHQIKTVMSNGQLIAKYDRQSGILRYLKHPKPIGHQVAKRAAKK